MTTLEFIVQKYKLDMDQKNMPIEIPDISREDLPELFEELGFNVGAEIGVESGMFSYSILSKTPGLRMLYSIDAWKAYRGYRDHTSQEKLDRFYKETQEKLKPFVDANRCLIWKKSSAEAVKEFPDNSLDFVYIDANHAFYNVAFDIHHWLKKVRPGGILAGHDYKKHKKGVNIHVKQVVQAYADSYYISPWFVIGLNAMLPGLKRDISRSWMFIKE